MGLQVTDEYYKHTLEKVSEMPMVPLLCGMYLLSQIEQ
jgi:hypothetical protein